MEETIDSLVQAELDTRPVAWTAGGRTVAKYGVAVHLAPVMDRTCCLPAPLDDSDANADPGERRP